MTGQIPGKAVGGVARLYDVYTGVATSEKEQRRAMVSVIDATEPLGRKFERSVATRLGCR